MEVVVCGVNGRKKVSVAGGTVGEVLQKGSAALGLGVEEGGVVAVFQGKALDKTQTLAAAGVGVGAHIVAEKEKTTTTTAAATAAAAEGAAV